MTPDIRTGEPRMDATNLYREDVITDRRVGTLRVMTPIKTDGSTDLGRPVLYVGEAQLLTQAGLLPLVFEIEDAASQIVVPPTLPPGFDPRGGPGGLPGGGKIHLR